ncbi:MAG: peptidoglycan DD-metalloendopeptidase family protein, partial [Fimbriimonadaceae bacterium]|nr:peptidoglycan DD-metalloendopeptidase family protein [Alphaproteobacteria bacterium]
YDVQEIVEPDDESGSGDGVISNLDGWQAGIPGAELLRVNLTEIEKSGGADAFGSMADKVIVIQPGDTISSLLRDNGASPEEAQDIAKAMEPIFPAERLKEGQEFRLSFELVESSGQLRPIRISLYDQGAHKVTVGLGEGGNFFAMDESQALLIPSSGELTTTPQGQTPQTRTALYYSLFETGVRQGIPEPVLNQMIRIHSYDVDFKRDTQTGDSLEVFYQMVDEQSDTGNPLLLYSALTVRGETRRFYRFRTSDDGVVDYYDDEGRSAKKFLIRKPINGGVLRSPYGMRRHPILGYRKMHTGVDWTVSRGTPIVAAGNGIVEQAKWSRGYGRYTIVRHANGYKTAYAHQTAFATGIEPGVRVRQGQIIGYVGSSGLSTGPHLHYEVIVNGNFVDPMRIRVPRGRTLQGRMLAAFQRERSRINRLMARPPASTQVASITDTPLRR